MSVGLLKQVVSGISEGSETATGRYGEGIDTDYYY